MSMLPGQAGQDDTNASASFAHSLSAAPIDSSLQLIDASQNNTGTSLLLPGDSDMQVASSTPTTSAIPSQTIQDQQLQQQPETRMAVAELLVSLGQTSRDASSEHNQTGYADQVMNTIALETPLTVHHSGAAAAEVLATAVMTEEEQSPVYRSAVDYVGSVRKAYLNNPRVYAEFLDALEQYHTAKLGLDDLVRRVMALFQDQPVLLMGFKDFLPEAENLMNRLVPPMMYSDYKGTQTLAAPQPPQPLPSSSTVPAAQDTQMADANVNNSGHSAANFLAMVKELSQQEPDMYQHLISLLRKFQKDHSYSTLYFYVSIILRYHPHLLQRFHNFMPAAKSGVEVTEPKIISKAPPEELVVSADFIEAKDFVQTVKYQAKQDMSMYDRFIFALEKYQRTGWTIDQVYSEVSLIFWNHPEALAGFKQFIMDVSQNSETPQANP
ncbi:Transcriptional regulatory protein sin3 [Podila epigama]|nr:Transcriptional regulatory protein sin3 [Podila epigama]